MIQGPKMIGPPYGHFPSAPVLRLFPGYCYNVGFVVSYRKYFDTRRQLRRANVDQAGRQVRHVRVQVHRRRIDLFGPQRLFPDHKPDETSKRQRLGSQVFCLRNATEI